MPGLFGPYPSSATKSRRSFKQQHGGDNKIIGKKLSLKRTEEDFTFGFLQFLLSVLNTTFRLIEK